MSYPRRHSGAALGEFLVLLLAMIPVFLAVPLIGKLGEIKQRTELAARYAGWQEVAGEHDDVARIRARVFDSLDRPIATTPAEGVIGTGRDITGGAFGPYSVGIGRFEQFRVEGDVDLPVEAGIAKAVSNAGRVLDGLPGNEWGLEVGELVTRGVEMGVGVPGWLSPDVCTDADRTQCLLAKSVIMSDAWASGSRAQAGRRSRSFVPASALETVGDTASLVGNLKMFKEVKDLKGALGFVDSDVEP